MKFLVVGVGPVGGFCGGSLAHAGRDVFFLARGPILAALRMKGLEVRGTRESFRVDAPAAERPPEGATADYVLVAVKAYQNESAAETFASAVGPETRIVSLQNGLGNEEFFAERFGAEKIIGGVAYVGGETVEPGVVTEETDGRLILGDFPQGASARTRELSDEFQESGVPCHVTETILVNLWAKLMANAVFNSLQTIHDCTLGDLTRGDLRREAAAGIEEINAVARALGIDIPRKYLDRPWKFCERYPTFRSSTRQDLARGKPLEAEALNGAVVEAGRRTGVPTPTHVRILEGLAALQPEDAR